MWSKWASGNRFRYFEIGNENDLTGSDDQSQAIKPWDATVAVMRDGVNRCTKRGIS